MTSADPLQALESEWDALIRSAPLDPEALIQAQKDLGLAMGDHPLCTVVRPYFVTARQHSEDCEAAEAVVRALEAAGRRLRRDPELARRFLGSWLDERARLFSFDPGLPVESVFARLDAYRTEDGLRFLEYNPGIPGGFSPTDKLYAWFRGLSAYEPFDRRHPSDHHALLPALLEALVEAWTAWGGSGRPRLALVAPAEMRAHPGVIRNAEVLFPALGRLGYEASLLDPGDLEFDGTHLHHGGQVIDMVLRAFTFDLIPQMGAALEPLLQALAARAVCMVNPFTFLGHKALFAVITDPAVDLGLAPRDRDLVTRHVPWTRQVLAGSTTDPDGAEIDLDEFALRARDGLVLKPVAGREGQGVMLGWTVSETEWRDALDRARAEETWILQQRVAAPLKTFPALSPKAEDVSYHIDCCPLMLNGRLAGYMVRLSTGELTNIAQGGSAIATFVLQD